jgi:hypothetical protein
MSPFWLNQSLNSSYLRHLKIGNVDLPLDFMTRPSNGLPSIQALTLYAMDATSNQLLHLLGQSETTLTSITLQHVTLDQNSSWQSFLEQIGTSFSLLSYFSVWGLEQFSGLPSRRWRSIGFLGFAAEAVAEECRAGLTLKFKGGVQGVPKRLRRIYYVGPSADLVLKRLASYTHYVET